MSVFVPRRGGAPSLIHFAEYLESSGLEHIDTEFIPNQNTRVDMEIEILEARTTGIFGARPTKSTVEKSFVLWNFSTYIKFDYGSKANKIEINPVGTHTISANKNVITIDDVTLTSTTATFNSGCNLLLFALNNGGSADSRKVKARLRSCQIYDNGVLVRDYRPCYDPDGVACLYDMANEEYVYNATGKGGFTAA